MKVKSWIFFAVITVILVWQAWNPHWFTHIYTDVSMYHRIIHAFSLQGSWANVNTNAYQPGALWFFWVVAKFIPFPPTLDAFMMAFVFMNVVLLVLHFSYFLYFKNNGAAFVFTLIALGMGPILFFRFELLVSGLCLLSWHLFTKRESDRSAAFFLGLGSAVKIYPILLLPFYLADIFQAKAIKKAVSMTMAFAAGAVLPIALYLGMKGSWKELLNSLSFNSLKPISLESFWGNIITLVHKSSGIPIRLVPKFGVNGLHSDIFLNAPKVDLIWVVLSSLTVIWLLWRFWPSHYRNHIIPYSVLLLFVTLSKTPNPQYLWWFLVFLPIVPLSLFSTRERILVLSSAFCALVLTQIIYPFYYSEFLEYYFKNNHDFWWVFGVCFLRNLLLIMMILLAFKETLSKRIFAAEVVSVDHKNRKQYSQKPKKKSAKKRKRRSR